jgi:hypothetical protein
MAAPVGMLHRGRMIMVMIVVLGQVDVRRRQHRGKHHRRDEQRCGRGAADPGGNHAGILSGLRISESYAVRRQRSLNCS